MFPLFSEQVIDVVCRDIYLLRKICVLLRIIETFIMFVNKACMWKHFIDKERMFGCEWNFKWRKQQETLSSFSIFKELMKKVQVSTSVLQAKEIADFPKKL